MVIRKIIQILLSNPQVGGRLIQTLADSWPIRAAAKKVAYIYMRGQSALEQKAGKILDETSKNNVQETSKRFANRFSENLKKEYESLQQQNEKNNPFVASQKRHKIVEERNEFMESNDKWKETIRKLDEEKARQVQNRRKPMTDEGLRDLKNRRSKK